MRIVVPVSSGLFRRNCQTTLGFRRVRGFVGEIRRPDQTRGFSVLMRVAFSFLFTRIVRYDMCCRSY